MTSRRLHNRYSFRTTLNYRVLPVSANPRWASGRTIDMSPAGILMQLEAALPIGAEIEAVLDWPGLYHGASRASLHIRARVLRSHAGATAVRILRHEFQAVGQDGILQPVVNRPPQLRRSA